MSKETIVFETFAIFPPDIIKSMTLSHPRISVCEHSINVRKHKVTIEVMDEPVEVITARLQHIWDTCHRELYRKTLLEQAKELGYEYIGELGNKLSIHL